MALDAAIVAASFGMEGIVMCFNSNDIGIDVDSITKLVEKASPGFKVLTPLRKTSAAEIRSYLSKLSKDEALRYTSCMFSMDCGFCAKCKRGY